MERLIPYDKMSKKEKKAYDRLEEDIRFITEFTRRMARAACCPVSREIPEGVRKELDEYLYRTRKKD